MGVTTGAARAGDIVLRIDRSVTSSAEGYRLISGGELQITGSTSTGVFWGTRTVLQLLRQSDTIPAGSATDWPSYAYRGIELCNPAALGRSGEILGGWHLVGFL